MLRRDVYVDSVIIRPSQRVSKARILFTCGDWQFTIDPRLVQFSADGKTFEDIFCGQKSAEFVKWQESSQGINGWCGSLEVIPDDPLTPPW